MLLLAADTTTAVNTVALCRDGRIVAETVVSCPRKHAERLMETVDWVLREAEAELKDVDALAISIGPGSFTGVRIGVATWKGLALGANLPLVAVPTLDAMTRLGAFRDGLVCPLIDAKMSEVFGAVYRSTNGRREKLSPDRVCPVADFLHDSGEPVTFLGDGAARYRNEIVAALPEACFAPAHCSVPRASAVAAEAFELLEGHVETGPALAAPVYLRKSQAELSRKARG